jgi:hypothetical protein
MNRTLGAVLLGAVLVIGGCGSGSQLPHTKIGSMVMIEGAVEDIVSTVNSPTYKPRGGDLGTDSDRIGMALMTFMKEAEGTSLAAGAQEVKAKFEALEKLTASRAPVEQQREAAQALKAAVQAMKAKL